MKTCGLFGRGASYIARAAREASEQDKSNSRRGHAITTIVEGMLHLKEDINGEPEESVTTVKNALWGSF